MLAGHPCPGHPCSSTGRGSGKAHFMKYPTIFHLISGIIRKAGVNVVLIGGFAVNYYKVTRQTVDIDFVCTKDDYNKIKWLLENEGYKTYREEENFIQLENKESGLMDIDFMFVDKDTFNKIRESGREIKIAEQGFLVPSLFHLIALKLHSIKNNPKREITDLPDIIRLIINNAIDVNDCNFKNLCLKYGTSELYERIKKVT